MKLTREEMRRVAEAATPLLERIASFPLPEDGASEETILRRGALAGTPPYRWALGDDFIREVRAALNPKDNSHG